MAITRTHSLPLSPHASLIAPENSISPLSTSTAFSTPRALSLIYARKHSAHLADIWHNGRVQPRDNCPLRPRRVFRGDECTVVQGTCSSAAPSSSLSLFPSWSARRGANYGNLVFRGRVPDEMKLEAVSTNPENRARLIHGTSFRSLASMEQTDVSLATIVNWT